MRWIEIRLVKHPSTPWTAAQANALLAYYRGDRWEFIKPERGFRLIDIYLTDASVKPIYGWCWNRFSFEGGVVLNHHTQ